MKPDHDQADDDFELADPSVSNQSQQESGALKSDDEIDATMDSVKSSKSPSTARSDHGSRTNPDHFDATLDSQSPVRPASDATPKNSDDLDFTLAPSQTGANTGVNAGSQQQDDATFISLPRDDQPRDADATSSLNSECPETLGRYQLHRLLGEGAFGRVYEAHDPQLDRRVAIKVAKSVSGDTQVLRFLREARAAAQLRHPNIIPVYEYGQVEGENIIVYQFVAGETLKAFIKRRKNIELIECVQIVKAIAEGLDYAHEQGIIHRDMKPDNVLIDSNGRPHIADFGCARSLEDETSLTMDGSILGTPMYMSPEQASGRSNQADRRTDIWSLGVMLYEMVSGKRPFQGDLTDLLHWICNHDAKPLRKIKPEIPLDIETICTKCLTRDLDTRFAKALDLADELGRFQRGEPILSRPIGPLRRTWLWAKRNQTVASLLGVVAVTLLIASIVSSTFAVRAYREQKTRAMAQLESLKSAEASALPGIFATLTPFRSTVMPHLEQELASNEIGPNERHRVRMAILELELDPEKRKKLADDMVDDLLTAAAGDFMVCRSCLKFRGDVFKERLWKITRETTDPGSGPRRFRAAAALALFDSQSSQWKSLAPDVVGYLTSLNQVEASRWLAGLTPVRDALKPRLVSAFYDHDDSDPTAQNAAVILSSLFQDQIDVLVDLVPDASPRQIPILTAALELDPASSISALSAKLDSISAQTVSTELNSTELDSTELNSTQSTGAENSVSRGAEGHGHHATHAITNLVTALIQLNDPYQWNQFSLGADSSVATELIEVLGPSSTPIERLTQQLGNWQTIDSDVLSGLLLSLGEFKSNQILDSQRSALEPTLLDVFAEHADSRVHSSARWLLKKWGFEEGLNRRENQLRRETADPDKNWHVDLAGNTFALFGPVGAFEMGLNPNLVSRSSKPFQTMVESADAAAEPFHRRQIPRRFGICIQEVTIGEFEAFEDAILIRLNAAQETLQQQLTDLQAEFESQAEADSTADQITSELKDKRKLLGRQSKRIDARIKSIERARGRREGMEQDVPVGDVDFWSALAYCRWLSEQQRTPFVVPSVEKLQQIYDAGTDLSFTQAHLKQTGYRLPTDAEWEYAVRGGSQSVFPFGRSVEFADRYAWFATNSGTQLHRVMQLKPGNTGLFDAMGNVAEWCLDPYREQLPILDAELERDFYIDHGPEFESHRSLDRSFRGGSYQDEVLSLRSTKRFWTRPGKGFPRLGFRLARTYDQQ